MTLADPTATAANAADSGDPSEARSTIESFREALPATLKRSVNTEVIAGIATQLADPDMREAFRENLLGYVSVMREGRFRVANYVDAVKYISHKLRGLSNLAAFSLVFPAKISDWDARGVASKDVASYVSAYNKSKLVGLLYEQTLVPAWVMNQDLYQKAINVQAEMMISARSEKVRVDAANSLLTHIKPPEAQKLELAVTVPENSAVAALRENTLALVAQQRQMIEGGLLDPNVLGAAPLRVVNEAGTDALEPIEIPAITPVFSATPAPIFDEEEDELDAGLDTPTEAATAPEPPDASPEAASGGAAAPRTPSIFE